MKKPRVHYQQNLRKDSMLPSATLYDGFQGTICRIENEGRVCLIAEKYYGYGERGPVRDGRRDFRDGSSVYAHWHKEHKSTWEIHATDGGYLLEQLKYARGMFLVIFVSPDREDKIGGDVRLHVHNRDQARQLPFEIVPIGGNHHHVQLKVSGGYSVSNSGFYRDGGSLWSTALRSEADEAVIELLPDFMHAQQIRSRLENTERKWNGVLTSFNLSAGGTASEKAGRVIRKLHRMESVEQELRCCQHELIASNQLLKRVQSELSNASHSLNASHEENGRLNQNVLGLNERVEGMNAGMDGLHAQLNTSNTELQDVQVLLLQMQSNVSNWSIGPSSSSNHRDGHEGLIPACALLIIFAFGTCIALCIHYCRRKRKRIQRLDLIRFNERNCRSNVNSVLRRNNNAVLDNDSDLGVSRADMQTIGNVKPIAKWKSQTMTKHDDDGEQESIELQRERSNSDLYKGEGVRETRQDIETPNSKETRSKSV